MNKLLVSTILLMGCGTEICYEYIDNSSNSNTSVSHSVSSSVTSSVGVESAGTGIVPSAGTGWSSTTSGWSYTVSVQGAGGSGGLGQGGTDQGGAGGM